MKNQRGVTLVALVVTIIILIVLAGLSINLLLGDNGIITKAKEAKENTELAKIEEEKSLNELYEQLDSGSFSIVGQLSCLGVVQEEWNAATTSGNKSYTIEEDGRYMFIIFNSAYNTTTKNAKMTLNENEVPLTFLVEQRPLYDGGYIYRTDVISCKKGDVITSVFTNSKEPDWKAYTSIIIFKV